MERRSLLSDERTGTRERILQSVHALYNARGPAHVTSAEVAIAVGLAEGNVHYYFRKKADLLDALFDIFEDDMREFVSRTGRGNTLESIAEHQRGWFRLMLEHQWYFRDTLTLLVIAPALIPRVQISAKRNRQVVRKLLDDVVSAGFMKATPEQLDSLLVNIWLVATHWIAYRHLTTNRPTLTQTDLEWGYAQVNSLYAPYLTSRGRPLAKMTLST